MPSFKEFTARFPELTLPLSIGEETVREVSRQTLPLPAEMIREHLLPLDPARVNDDFTEFVAIARLPAADDYIGLIYWRADLAQYHYNLVTIHPKTHEVIDRLVIAGTSYDGEELTQTSALINESLMIYQVSGQQQGAEEFEYAASSSTARRFQLAEIGRVVEL